MCVVQGVERDVEYGDSGDMGLRSTSLSGADSNLCELMKVLDLFLRVGR